MHEESDEQHLVDRAKGGDHHAFELLYEGARERVLATIRSRLSPNTRRTVDPEDVFQAALVRAMPAVQRFEWRGAGSFCRWLESIAIHVALDAVRSQTRRTVLRIDRDTAGDGTSPSKGIRRRERLERLEASLKALSPDYRTVLRLARMDGLPVKEIANRMGRSESAVHNLLLRATKQLRRSFGDTESLHLGDDQFGNAGESNGC